MLDEKQINKIREMREKGLTINETAKALGISDSSVKKYTSEGYERENELDEKAGNLLTKQFDLEGYDFQDEIAPLVYKLKIQANEIDITLYDYLNDISNTMNKFLRITDKPEWFYYVFCELAKNYSLINDHIDATKIMEAVDNFYNREIEMEESEEFLAEIEAKTEHLLKNTREEYKYWEEKIIELKKESENLIIKNERKAERLLKNTKEELEDLNNQINETQKNYDALTSLQTVMLNKIIEQNDKNNEQTKQENGSIENLKQENMLMEIVLKEVSMNFPVELEMIVNKVKNEIK